MDKELLEHQDNRLSIGNQFIVMETISYHLIA